jgi:hypothetical protein
MGGARALIASLGASISLVAGAALSLLLASVLFAFPGSYGGADESAARAALLVDGHSPNASPSRADGERPAGAVFVRPAAAAPRPARDVVRRSSSPTGLRLGDAGDATRRPLPSATGVTELGPVSAPLPANPAGSGPVTGDGVREFGDSVTTTVGDTGDAVGAATELLGPPVSQAVQDVLNVVESLLKGATTGLAGGLDKTLPR